jgi:peptidoglycan hydrolase-like protein with peptidoglycan-binding domain
MQTKMFTMNSTFVDTVETVTLEHQLTISAPVGERSHPRVVNLKSDVEKIQRTLNQFPNRDGGPVELLKVDGIVGPKTIAAILNFQTVNQFKKLDKIVDPEGPTMDNLRAGPDVIPQESVSRFIVELPRVLALIATAEAHLSQASSALSIPGSLFGASAFTKLDRNYHTKNNDGRRLAVDRIQRVFRLIRTAVGHLTQGTIVADDAPVNLQENAFMYTFEDGFNSSKLPADKIGRFKGIPVDRIYITLKGRQMAANQFRYAMLHELCHFVTGGKSGVPLADDQAYFHKNRQKYDSLSTDLALRNADTYARFAHDVIGQLDLVI